MGRDKALLMVDGEPMVRRVGRAVRAAGAAAVVTVGGDEAGLTAALLPLDGVRVLADHDPGEGPLGGILTGLVALDHELVLVVACDLLAPDPTAMAVTVQALVDEPAAEVAAPELDGRVQWLHAAWRRPSVQGPLAERFAAGERSIHRAVAGAGLRRTTVGGVAPRGLADADTPDDLPDDLR
jgi:molybdopterin-guanine dinucleotide biosynthesis protein A